MNIYGYVRGKMGEVMKQSKQLKETGIDNIVYDKPDSTKELDKLLNRLKPGDVIAVCELNNIIASSLSELLSIIPDFISKGINLISLTEKIDTIVDKCFYNTVKIITTFEKRNRALRSAKAREACKQAKAHTGRPAVSDAVLAQAKEAFESSDVTAAQVAERFGISRSKFFQYLKSEKMKSEQNIVDKQ